jgi:hypothetical protein
LGLVVSISSKFTRKKGSFAFIPGQVLLLHKKDALKIAQLTDNFSYTGRLIKKSGLNDGTKNKNSYRVMMYMYTTEYEKNHFNNNYLHDKRTEDIYF